MTGPANAADDALLEELLGEWLARRAAGEPVEVATLCGDRPELAPALRAMAALADALPGAETTPADPLLGRRLGGRYVLTARLGAGGMGLVYAARDEQLGRDVAVKVLDDLFARDADRVQRFEREARALAAVADPHIVSVHDLDLCGEPPFLVMDRVVGCDLGAFVRALREAVPAGGLPQPAEVAAALRRLAMPAGDWAAQPWPPLVARLGQQMCAALAAAHGLGVVHRDVKPSNFMLDVQGRVRLLDFGLARRDLDPSLTAADARVGTPLYMAPEVLRGGIASAASDLYALGATLYELLCLQPPFTGTGSELEARILADEPPPPRAHRAGVPRDLAAICLKALAKNPARRYRAAADFAADLARFIAYEPVLARPRVWPAPVRAAIGTFRRYRGAILLAGALALVAALAATAAGHFLGSEQARASAAEAGTRRSAAARLHAGLSPYAGFAAGRSDRLRDPQRPALLAALDGVLEQWPADVVARFLRWWVRGEEQPAPAVVAADRAVLASELGAGRLERLAAVARAVQERDRVDRQAGAGQMRAALAALAAEPQPLDALARRLRITASLQLAEFDPECHAEIAAQVLADLDADEAERHGELRGLLPGDSGRTAFTWFARGAALQLRDDLRGARDAYLQCDRLCPNQPATLHALARIHRLLGQPNPALAYIEQAVALVPEPHVNHLEQHARVLAVLGHFARAEAVLGRFPDDPDSQVRRHLAQVWIRARQAASEPDRVARARLLAEAGADLHSLRELAAQGRLGSRQVRALESSAAELDALQHADPTVRVRLYLALLLEGAGGDAVGDPLNWPLLELLGDALIEAGQADLGALLQDQALTLRRLEQDGVRVR